MRPTLVINPRSDDAFANEAHLLLGNGTETPAEMERALRKSYPQAMVRASVVSGFGLTWYAYRDGRWIGNETIQLPTDPAPEGNVDPASTRG